MSQGSNPHQNKAYNNTNNSIYLFCPIIPIFVEPDTYMYSSLHVFLNGPCSLYRRYLISERISGCTRENKTWDGCYGAREGPIHIKLTKRDRDYTQLQPFS